jgi:EAL domain-containing protein (putative c-di-GMP-specific phosphodiesterase class I)/FixJ family two-component response regulator
MGRMSGVPVDGPRLLVVDDEPEVVELMVEFAGRAGYRVTATSSPGEFDQLYSDDFAVVMLDLSMPGIDGIELIRRLAARRSRARVVLISGFDERVLEAARQLAASQGLDVLGSLTKPIRLAQLTALLDASADIAPVAAARAFQVTLDELQRAFADDRLIVHYQPQVELQSGHVIGVEALVRWRHTDGALIPPDMFVELTEAAGLSLELTWRVIAKAMAHAAVLRSVSNLSIAVNLPPAALTDVAFPDHVVERLRNTDLTPQTVHFEVTETSVAREPVAALDILTRLRLKGFSLAIDDFGTGYSSLEQLGRLPFSALKIDQTFVRRMDRDPSCRAIVNNCIELGHDLGLTVIAEGVETAGVWQTLAKAGCDVVQGYFVSRPAPAEAIAEWLPTWRKPQRIDE